MEKKCTHLDVPNNKETVNDLMWILIQVRIKKNCTKKIKSMKHLKTESLTKIPDDQEIGPNFVRYNNCVEIVF